MKQALEGIKVLDLTRVLAGPYATMIMADMGAEVIKVEMPGVGDDSRQFGPYVNGESAYFMSINRNKRSMTLNLKKEKAQRLFMDMMKKCDVIVENFRPGTMEKLGLGYDKLKEVNPAIIYAACSGFGHSGPYSQRAAYDAVVQAMGGIMSITGEKDGKFTRVGPSIGDITAGLFSAIGILAAINYRNQTGQGQKVDVAMLDCQLAILENAIARYVVTGEIPKPAGNRHSSIVPFEPFETADGEIMIAAGNDVLWAKFCEAIHCQDLIEDEKYKTNPLRNQNYPLLRPIIADKIKEKTTEDWLKILDAAGVPNGPINTIDKVLENPQLLAREMVVEVQHPTAGNFKMPGVPIKMSETQGEITRPAPILGEHTHEILKELLDLSDEEISELQVEGIF
ncbi:CaiB/BaiF CoA transferase family protein [Alkaliphilus serpentinus]|uniref:CoA transferase n=1 Tax=Alkaliphilus serpentinus TaxID=1482731 RepID=A0A833HQM6_9FIRM|nr:CaiB/BaiF CoA-transferase family protein [Alkaliphilus serpentinus]KAB3532096.1 CoA transferase [Alkaliphilus serpentinus]